MRRGANDWRALSFVEMEEYVVYTLQVVHALGELTSTILTDESMLILLFPHSDSQFVDQDQRQ